MGAVHLSVADLDRSIAYYERAIGLRVHDRDDGRAALGAGGEDLLVLREEPGARPALGYAGLYHFALLVPEREDLARWLAHAAREQVPLVGPVRPLRQRGDLPLATPTSTASRSTGTARARSGRARSPSG